MKEIKISTHTFTCGMITLTAAVMDFIFDNPIAGWILLCLTAMIFTFGIFMYKQESKENEK